VPVEELPHAGIHGWVAEPVPSSLHHVQRALHAGRGEGSVEPLRLIEGHNRVLIPVDDQKRRIVRADVGHWARQPGEVHPLRDRPAEEERHRRRGAPVRRPRPGLEHGEEIGRTKEVAHRLDPARLVEIPSHVSFELGHVTRRPEEGSQVAAGGRAPRPDPFRVKPVPIGVGTQPADGRLAVVDLRRERGLVAEPVVDARHGVPVAQHLRSAGSGLVPAPPASAVDPHHHRQTRPGFPPREVQVEPERLCPDAGVLEIAQHLGRYRLSSSHLPLGHGEE